MDRELSYVANSIKDDSGNGILQENKTDDILSNSICIEKEDSLLSLVEENVNSYNTRSSDKSDVNETSAEINGVASRIEQTNNPDAVLIENVIHKSHSFCIKDTTSECYVHRKTENSKDNTLESNTSSLEVCANEPVTTKIHDKKNENELYVSSEIDKLNTNESESIAELNAITTQNFNLIHNEFDQNKINLIPDCLVDETELSEVTRAYSRDLVSDTSCNVDRISGCTSRNVVETELITSDEMCSNRTNPNEIEIYKVTQNTFLDAELNNTYEDIIKDTIQDANNEMGNYNTMFPSILLSNDYDLDLKNENELLSTNVSDGCRSNTENDKVFHTDDFTEKSTITDYSESSSLSTDSDITNTSSINPSTSFKNAIIKSSLKRPNSDDNSSNCRKKVKKGISFDKVSVFYFPRTQGFTCIPSQGGSTLGMSWSHSHTKTYSLMEHAERRAPRQHQLADTWDEYPSTSSDDSETDELLTDSEVDYENCNFLQPIATKERRAILRASGINKIDSAEKDECRQIRSSRENCGCSCQTYCDPDTCTCSQAGIKCQVDRLNFPCSCSRDGCVNPNGRIEFNPVRVRTHYIHTLMRMELEKKQLHEQMSIAGIGSGVADNLTSAFTTNMELQSSVSADSLLNFRCAATDIQSYYHQQQQMQSSSPYNIGINSSCFNFNYNQFFSTYQQASSTATTTTPFTLEPRAIDYHSSASLYDATAHMFTDNNSDEHLTVTNEIDESYDDKDREQQQQQQDECAEDENEVTLTTVKDFADLLEASEFDDEPNKVDNNSEASNKSTDDDSVESQQREIDGEVADEEALNAESESSDDLGEITVVEAVTA